MRHLPPDHDLWERGVWWCDFLSRDGHPVAVAVDSNHRCIDWEVVRPEDDLREIAAFLRARLQREDPQPERQLQLLS